MNLRITILLSLILILGCNKPIDDDINNYNQKSTELVNSILKNNEPDCSCLLEPPHQSLLEIADNERPEHNNKKDLLEALELNNDSVLDKQDNLSKRFRIDELSLNYKMDLIKRSEVDSIFQKNGSQKGREILWKKCPSGWLYLSPPIFNESYNIAVIEISICSPGGSISIYKFTNGNWEYVDSIGVWLS
ncbi:hypothetical protein [Altibacter lentus]|uniref:hypothetical protein n=1 Tax=Altibacter lentus TaxID=1223410 RepID=UPI0005516628|nr:hypothetical protein [Altibacter lentus]